MRSCFFTSIALNYLAKALALADSVANVYPDARMVIAIVDHSWLSEQQLSQLESFVEEFRARGHCLEFLDPLSLYPRPDLFRYRFNVVEACTSVKPAVAMHLLDRDETVTYMDPDTILYRALPGDAKGYAWDFQVTPHVLAPAARGQIVSERMFLFYGTFNLGYFAVRNTPEAKAFLVWWRDFCVDYGADAPQAGLFVDQKPIDLVHCFLDKVHVIRDPGCNMGWWNIFGDGRTLETGRLVRFAGQVQPLVFYHFSNMDTSRAESDRLVANPLQLYEWPIHHSSRLSGQPILRELFADYQQRTSLWKSRAAAMGRPAQMNSQHDDAPRLTRILLSEALRRGMRFPSDPYGQSVRSVSWNCLVYVLRHMGARDFRSAFAAVRSMMRLTLASRLLQHAKER